MALEWQKIHVDFGDGLDTQTDPKAVVVSKLLQAKNVAFPSPGVLRTRHGHTALTMSLGALSSPSKLLPHRGGIYVISEQTNATIRDRLGVTRSADLGRFAGLQRKGILREGNGKTYESDIAVSTSGTYLMVGAAVHEPTSGFTNNHIIVWLLVDASTGEVIKRFLSALGGATSRPRVVRVDQYFWCFYFDAATGLRAFRVDTALANVDIGDALIDGAALGPVDVAPMGGNTARFLLVYLSGAGVVNYSIRDAAAAIVISNSTIVGASTDCVGICGTANERVYVLYRDTGTASLWCRGASTNGVSTMATVFSVAVEAAFPAAQLVGVCRLDSTHAQIVYNVSVAGPLYRIKARSIDQTGALAAALTGMARQVSSKPFVPADTQPRALFRNVKGGSQIDPIQSSTLIQPIDTTVSPARVDGQVARLSASSFSSSFSLSLPSIAQLPDGRFVMPLITTQRQRANYDFTLAIEQSGVDLLYLDTVSSARYCTAELGGLTYIAGGQLRCFDGVCCFEAGFATQPQAPVLSASNTGGTIDAGQHQYLVVWEWTDAQGNEHRSAPSLASTITFVAPNLTLNGTVEPINWSNREALGTSTGAHIRAAVYGTTANGVIFYRMQAPTGTPLNTAGLDTPLTFSLINPDSVITAFPTLYTDGGALANYAPPSCDTICVHKNRVFLASAEDGSIWYSKEYVPGEAVGFNDALSFRLPTPDLPTAVASMDDKLLVFTANAVFVVTGEFPDARGIGTNFTIDRVPSDVGAIDWQGIVVAEAGCFFASRKGIFLVTRGLQLDFVGKDVQFWTDNYTVRAAHVTPTLSEVRFAVSNQAKTPDTQELVLNTQNRTQASPHGTWSTFDYPIVSQDYLDAKVVNGAIFKLFSGPTIWLESASSFDDIGSFITWVVETANIYPFGRQGFMRCRTATLLGKYVGAHTLQIEVAYNGDDAFAETTSFSNATLVALAREQVSHHLVQQKCAGVRLKITAAPGGGIAEGVTMSGIVLECASKRGSFDRTMPGEARQ